MKAEPTIPPSSSLDVPIWLLGRMLAHCASFRDWCGVARWEDAIEHVGQDFHDVERLDFHDPVTGRLPLVCVVPATHSGSVMADGVAASTGVYELLFVDRARQVDQHLAIAIFRQYLGRVYDEMLALAGADFDHDQWTFPPLVRIDIPDSISFGVEEQGQLLHLRWLVTAGTP